MLTPLLRINTNAIFFEPQRNELFFFPRAIDDQKIDTHSVATSTRWLPRPRKTRKNMKYDLVVIGSGPAGQKGAFAAAKLGKKVAIVEHRHQCLGGVCLHSGTIPSKTLREAILYLTGFRQRDVYTERFRGKSNITMDTLRRKLKSVIDTELDVIREQFDRNNVDIIGGRGSFIDRNHLSVERGEDSSIVSTDKVLVACGTRP